MPNVATTKTRRSDVFQWFNEEISNSKATLTGGDVAGIGYLLKATATAGEVELAHPIDDATIAIAVAFTDSTETVGNNITITDYHARLKKEGAVSRWNQQLNEMNSTTGDALTDAEIAAIAARLESGLRIKITGA